MCIQPRSATNSKTTSAPNTSHTPDANTPAHRHPTRPGADPRPDLAALERRITQLSAIARLQIDPQPVATWFRLTQIKGGTRAIRLSVGQLDLSSLLWRCKILDIAERDI